VGGFLGIGGSGQKTDRKQTLEGYGDLKNVFNFAMPLGNTLSQTGQQTTSSAVSGLNDVNQYWKGILSGSRPQVMQAVAPVVNAAADQGDAARREQVAAGTSRAGGANAANQEADTRRQSTVDNVIAALPGQAAEQSAKIDAVKASVGSGIVGQALQALGLGDTAAAQLTDSSIASRPTSNAINQQTQQQIGQLVGTLLLGV
jgi:hypothetical protein